MIGIRACIPVVVAVVLIPPGCKKSSGTSDSANGSAGAAAPSGQVSEVEQQARAAAMAEIQKHWAKGPDGWTTAMVSGSPYAPDRYLRQFRELGVGSVETAELGDSDRLNGFEWAGSVAFKPSPCREAGDPGIMLDGLVGAGVNRQRGRWTQWVDFQPEALRVQKVKGKWQVHPDTLLLHGNLPAAQDFASAGVR